MHGVCILVSVKQVQLYQRVSKKDDQCACPSFDFTFFSLIFFTLLSRWLTFECWNSGLLLLVFTYISPKKVSKVK